ncbi:phosphatidylinositol-3-phosphatase myotubularin-2 [Spatholobus suberectus]|nr:phosphatidylinositol-3-phosphatase myotubularin-2 [Spatholobus suberectus]
MARCPGAANFCCLSFQDDPSPSENLGILAFDAAKTMCRLVSLYNSLSDPEIRRLRRHVIKSKSVSKLNSPDECFLLSLACAEHLEDLNLAAAAASRLARRCPGDNHPRFDAGKLEFGTRDAERNVETIEKLVCATRSLHRAMESLAEAEASERKMQRWRTSRAKNDLKVKVECFNDKIIFYRRQVHCFKQVSLWNQTFDKVVGLMGRIICIVYNRICSVFGSLVTGILPVRNHQKNNNNKNDVVKGPNFENCCCRVEHRELYRMNLCLLHQNKESLNNWKESFVTHSNRIRLEQNCLFWKILVVCTKKNEESLKKRGRSLCYAKKGTETSVFRFQHPPPQDGDEVAQNNRVLRLAPATTVGGAGLSLRYANVIMLAERCMHAPDATIGDDARVALYEMLPGRLKAKLRGKLRREWVEWEKLKGEGHAAVVMRWRVEAEEVMEWLLPVAHDMVRWQAERNLEKQKFEMRPTVLLLQTLHYSNLEKVEEAIVEVLVGLSYMYWNLKL